MTIRYKCEECGSVLNIKDEKAGTQGKCPKCKTEFLVPQPGGDEPDSAASVADSESAGPDSSHELLSTGSESASGERDAADKGSDDFSDDEIEKILETEQTKPARSGGGYGVAAGKDDDDDDDDDDDADADDAPEEDEEPLALRARRRKPVDFDDDDDDDDDEDERPRAKKGKERPSRGEAASTSAGVAKGLMARGEKGGATAKDERRSKRLFGAGGEHEGDEGDEGFTLKDKAGYLAKFLVPAFVVLALSIGFYFWYMRGWQRGDLPELAVVKGVVTLDGNPLKNAEIQYIPQQQDPNKPNLKLSSSGGITNEKGEFSLIYTAHAEGAVLGKHRVQIICYGEDGKQIVPSNYNVRSELYREVKSGSNKETFELKSPAPDGQGAVGGYNP